MSKILANQIANYGDNSPVEVKEGVNIPAGKPLQADGVSGTAGQILSSTGNSIQWINNFSGSYTDLTDKPTIPPAQVQSDWNATSGIGVILNKPIVPAQPSVTISSASGSGSLSYNQSNGLFTYTPPDLSSFATSVDLGNAVANAANWDAAYSWGDHSLAGYASGANESNWNTAYGWGDHAAVGYLTTGLQDLVDDTTPQLGGTLDLNGNGITGIGTISCTGLVTSANSILLGNASSEFIIQFSQSTGTSPQIRNSIGTSGIAIYGAYNFGGTHAQDVHLGTSGQPSWFKNVEPYTDASYDLGTSSKKWNNFYVNNLHVSGTTDIALENLGDVDVTAGLSDQQVLKWDAASSSWKPANDLVGGQSAIELADLSVSTNPAGSPSLSYNNTNGVFTYTPPDLTNYDTAYSWGDHSTQGYLTEETDPIFTAHVASGILQTNINNWNSAYSWGNHAVAGYATTTQLNSAVANSSNWDTAYSWGDHSTQGYLTVETDPVFSSSPAGGILSTDITNWDNAFGWGDHSTQGYLTDITGSSIGNLSDVNLPTTPSVGHVLKYDGANWTAQADNSGNVIANVTISDTAPGSPSAGDLWWESDKGRLKIYYNDTDSSQWVDASPPLKQDRIASTGAPATATSTGTAGEIRYDSNYVYICVATNTWKRAALSTW